MTFTRIKQSVLALILAAGSMQCCAIGTAASEPLPVTAIWNLQQLPFRFRSENIYYSCDSLRTKIAAILTAVGARADLRVDLPCGYGSLTNGAFAAIQLATPIEATPQNVAAATSHSAQTELIARLNKVDLPNATDIQRFPAAWQTVLLGRGGGLSLDAADCELLQALSEQVFPHLAVQLAKRRIHCPGTGSTRANLKVAVTALMPTSVAALADAHAKLNASGGSSSY